MNASTTQLPQRSAHRGSPTAGPTRRPGPAVAFRGIPIGELRSHRGNVRERLEGIDELASSIRALGILQPLIVNDHMGHLIVTDGARRLAAATRAGVPVVPCLVTAGAGEREVLTTMLAAAMHKELAPLEQACGFSRLIDHGMTRSEIARSTGYSPALVANRLLLLELPVEAQDLLEEEQLTLGQATDLARQVKAKRSGATVSGPSKKRHLAGNHPLAREVKARCEHKASAVIIGATGCGECWEATIRADERARAESSEAAA